jgi:uncharacterized phage protein (TIGR02218 family)
MKTVSAPLQTLLNSGTFIMADALKITIKTLSPPTPLYYSNFDQDFYLDGSLYKTSDLVIHRSSVSWKNDLSVDSMELNISPKDYTPFLIELKWGIFDGAKVELYRVFFNPGAYSATPSPVGSILIFVGNIGDVEADRTSARITVNSLLDLLNASVPREIYQSSCVNVFGGSICRATSKYFNGTVQSIIGTQNNWFSSTIYSETGWLNGGYLVWNTGKNVGRTMSINNAYGWTVYLLEPMRDSMTIGDTFTAYTSCDKTSYFCGGLYNNMSNFKGFPDIPPVGTFGT